ncbi:MAG: DMT family transporter [Lachnospiraceae bacterium]|nr:DMT family transporter [Lachnospiraceae bacterium]
MQKLKWKNMVLLLLAAFIWGVAFVAQSVGMDYIGPFTFNGVRCLIGSAFLLPCIFVFDRTKNMEEKEKIKVNQKTLWLAGIFCGIILFVATNAQQIGLQYTTAGKAGFITALYIVFVPIIGIFLKKKCHWNVWISVLIAVVGFYLLSIKDGFSLSKGDFFVFICALVFPFHIWCVNHFAPFLDGVRLSCIQFCVCGILSVICMFFLEKPELGAILSAWAPILYAGILSCGVGYTLQIIGQKNFNPTIASLLMSFESVFSVLAGWVLLGQALSKREMAGCVLIFAGVVLAQIPAKKEV